MIAFERIKELAKNRKMFLREVNDKAKLVNCFLYFFAIICVNALKRYLQYYYYL